MTGKWPAHDVDHINTDRTDNRWCNLREATRSQNVRNGRRHRDSLSPYKGVSWMKRDKFWSARIYVNGRNLFLGYYDTAEKAHEVYVKAAAEHFGEFARAA